MHRTIVLSSSRANSAWYLRRITRAKMAESLSVPVSALLNMANSPARTAAERKPGVGGAPKSQVLVENVVAKVDHASKQRTTLPTAVQSLLTMFPSLAESPEVKSGLVLMQHLMESYAHVGNLDGLKLLAGWQYALALKSMEETGKPPSWGCDVPVPPLPSTVTAVTAETVPSETAGGEESARRVFRSARRSSLSPHSPAPTTTPVARLPLPVSRYSRLAAAIYGGHVAPDPFVSGRAPLLPGGELVFWQPHTGLLMPAHAILLDHDWETIVVVIRGTSGLTDLLADLAGAPTPYAKGSCSTHAGMTTIAQALMTDAYFKLVAARCKTMASSSSSSAGPTGGAGGKAAPTCIFTAKELLGRSPEALDSVSLSSLPTVLERGAGKEEEAGRSDGHRAGHAPSPAAGQQGPASRRESLDRLSEGSRTGRTTPTAPLPSASKPSGSGLGSTMASLATQALSSMPALPAGMGLPSWVAKAGGSAPAVAQASGSEGLAHASTGAGKGGPVLPVPPASSSSSVLRGGAKDVPPVSSPGKPVGPDISRLGAEEAAALYSDAGGSFSNPSPSPGPAPSTTDAAAAAQAVEDGPPTIAGPYAGRPGISSILQRLLDLHPGYKVVVTGHSLGAAVAALLTVQLRLCLRFTPARTQDVHVPEEEAVAVEQGRIAEGSGPIVSTDPLPLPSLRTRPLPSLPIWAIGYGVPAVLSPAMAALTSMTEAQAEEMVAWARTYEEQVRDGTVSAETALAACPLQPSSLLPLPNASGGSEAGLSLEQERGLKHGAPLHFLPPVVSVVAAHDFVPCISLGSVRRLQAEFRDEEISRVAVAYAQEVMRAWLGRQAEGVRSVLEKQVQSVLPGGNLVSFISRVGASEPAMALTLALGAWTVAAPSAHISRVKGAVTDLASSLHSSVSTAATAVASRGAPLTSAVLGHMSELRTKLAPLGERLGETVSSVKAEVMARGERALQGGRAGAGAGDGTPASDATTQTSSSSVTASTAATAATVAQGEEDSGDGSRDSGMQAAGLGGRELMLDSVFDEGEGDSSTGIGVPTPLGAAVLQALGSASETDEPVWSFLSPHAGGSGSTGGGPVDLEEEGAAHPARGALHAHPHLDQDSTDLLQQTSRRMRAESSVGAGLAGLPGGGARRGIPSLTLPPHSSSASASSSAGAGGGRHSIGSIPSPTPVTGTLKAELDSMNAASAGMLGGVQPGSAHSLPTPMALWLEAWTRAHCTPQQKLVVPGRIYHIVRVVQEASSSSSGSSGSAAGGWRVTCVPPKSFFDFTVSPSFWDDHDAQTYLRAISATAGMWPPVEKAGL